MLNVIYNPTAGKGRARRVLATVIGELDRRGVEYKLCETQGKKDAINIAKRLTETGERDIVVLGGDGTVNEVLNGIVDPERVRLGIVPCGSGNDFATVAGIPTTPLKAVKLILEGQAKPTDYLDCSGVRGLNIIGAGIDVKILERCAEAKVLKGRLNYFVSLIHCLLRFQLDKFTAEYNHKRNSYDGMLVCACNGKCFGGGIQICPVAKIDDGKMDVVIVKNVKKKQLFPSLVKLMRGKVLSLKFTLHEMTEQIKAQFEKPTTVQIDGELYYDLKFDVSIISGKLKVYR